MSLRNINRLFCSSGYVGYTAPSFANVFIQLIGPHVVVNGNQKNYKSLIDHNLTENIDKIYFEDIVAKVIIFRAFEREYGIKPNAIGDITDPPGPAYNPDNIQVSLSAHWSASLGLTVAALQQPDNE